jgi:hypothetical protein
MMKIKSVFILAIFLYFLAVRVQPVYAGGPKLLLNPETLTIQKDSSTTISVLVNSAGISVFGADAVISYNPDALEISSISKGNFFSDFTYSNNSSSGKLEVHGYFGSLFDMRAGNGTVATFRITSKQQSGTATLNFICNNSANSSQILDTSGKNILPCSETNNATITFTNSPDISPTATGTQPTGKPNTAPNCSSLSISPNTGFVPISITATCAASDGENDIVSAEFDFGDGTKKVVDQNVGQYGSISTTHTYTQSGLFTILCRVKDNNQAFSAIINECKTSVEIKSHAQPTASNTLETTPKTKSPTITPIALEEVVTPTSIQATLEPTYTPISISTAAAVQTSMLFQIGKIIAITVIVIMLAFVIRGLTS